MRIICKLLLIFITLTSVSYAKKIENFGVIMKADEVHYDANSDSVNATGGILIKMNEYTINADKIYYKLKKDILFIEGNIRITDQTGKIIYGERAVFKDKLKCGVLQEFIIKLDKNVILASRLAKRLNKNRILLENSIFTPCTMDCGNKPIWQLRSEVTDIDQEKQKITYKNVFFEIYGVPVMYLPYFFHPIPSAPAQSGLLVPMMKHNDFVVPLYFRVKPNLDFTISPRLSKNHTILEGEFRHKIHSGDYQIHGSYGNPKFEKTDANNVTKNVRPRRYHIFADGNFVKNHINYGFDINTASDKAYLTNYQGVYDSYLTSRIYANMIDRRNYFALEGLYFQDLRTKNNKPDIKLQNDFDTPFILPNIKTQHVFGLNKDDSILLNVRNNTMVYKEPYRTLARTSLDFELMLNSISNQGHMISTTLANRTDLYWLNSLDKAKDRKYEQTLHRHIPEFRTHWRYPLIKTIGSKTNISIEPNAMVVLGKKYKSEFNKFVLVDPHRNELAESNIFNANSFSGIDFHDYGNRLSYGVNANLLSDDLYIVGFLGQRIHKNNTTTTDNYNYIGKFSVTWANDFEIFYRFRKNQQLKPIRDEVGINFVYDRIKASSLLTNLHQVSRYFAKTGFEPEEDKASQLSFDVDYRVTNSLWISGASKIDFIGKSTRLLMRTIRVTYLFDCVSMNASVTDHFLHDSMRGVKRNRSKSFAVGLKVINM